MTNPDIRCRFAPSPTGYLHVGSARTALFNWLFARSVGGTFVLRIEDTDGDRNRPELIDVIFDELRWLGIDWDEGPSFQSESRDRHRQVVSDLLASGNAYLSERVDEQNTVVDGAELVDGLAVRYRVPSDRQVVFTDAVRGDVSFETNDLEDFVIWRSNGTPTFLLANAVDDADMGITHAIRGEDLLSTTPKVQLLMEEIGATPPIYAHLPLLVNEQRKKLSKRRDDVSIADYRTRGYLPEAMVNYLALLGWGPDDDIEIRPVTEIIDKFDLGRVNKAAAFFDLKKLDHFNSTYIQNLATSDFVEQAVPYLRSDERWAPDAVDVALVAEFAGDVQQRVATLSEVPQWYDWLFLDTIEIEEKAMNKGLRKAKQADEVLDGVVAAFADCVWEEDVLNETVRAVGDTLGVKSAVPVRVAVTGKMGGIPLYGPLVRLGREKTIERLRNARGQLERSE
ncbi:MAG: glutamate--tRNA ligase family protein [Acidimicrobiales bacterium]|jgi:glutamyl-tRNA synthetase